MINKDNTIPMADKEGHVSSTAKALSILECFSTSEPELSLTQISQRLNIPKSTTLNQIRTLEDAGYLYKVKNSSSYRLGYKIMELNYKLLSSMSVVRYVMPFMDSILSAGNENVYLSTFVNGRVLFLECFYSNKLTISHAVAGKTAYMHSTGCGKAMLSLMPQHLVDQIIEQHGLPAVTANTCTDYDTLMQELALIRKRGYAIDNEEDAIGCRCVAAPIHTVTGEVAGALSVSGSYISMTDEKIQQYAKLLIASTYEITPYAGHFPAIQLQNK